jgi:uncharacterized protein YukE
MKLYELSTQYAQLVDMLNNTDSDMIELVETINDTLDSISDSIEIKADSIAKMIRQLEAEKEMIDAESKRLADRGAKLAKQKEQLKSYLFQNMQIVGQDKIKTALFSFTIKNNPPSVNEFAFVLKIKGMMRNEIYIWIFNWSNLRYSNATSRCSYMLEMKG